MYKSGEWSSRQSTRRGKRLSTSFFARSRACQILSARPSEEKSAISRIVESRGRRSEIWRLTISNLEKITYSRRHSGICIAVAPNVKKKREKWEKFDRLALFDRIAFIIDHRTQILKQRPPALNKREDAAHTMTSTTNLYNRSSLFFLLSIHLCVSARNLSQRRRNSENSRTMTQVCNKSTYTPVIINNNNNNNNNNNDNIRNYNNI